MNKIFNVFIIIFVSITIYVVKDDLFVAYQKVKGSNNISDSMPFEKVNELTQAESPKINIKSESPGALRVISSVLSTTFEDSKLTNSGVLVWTNQSRVQTEKLEPFRESYELNASAKKKLDDMFRKQYFEHISPDGFGVSDLGKESGYQYILIGENLAMGNFKNDESVVKAWMDSPGHRANILHNGYSDIGIAVGHGTFEGNEVWIAVQHFGKPRSSCPFIDQDLKININNNQDKISVMQKSLHSIDKDIKEGTSIEESFKINQIKKYNTLVGEYNNLLNKIKKDIDSYNTQVKAFNTCVAEIAG